MSGHTKEPWPVFTDIAVNMTPDPEGEPVAVLSWDDYMRARACVNACADIPTEKLEQHKVTLCGLTFNEIEKQRDKLLEAMKSIFNSDTNQVFVTTSQEQFARATIAEVEAGQ